MEPLRITFWNIPHWAELTQYLLGAVTVVVFLYGVYRHVRAWRRGQAESVNLTLKKRLGALVQYAFLQKRLWNDPYAAIMHLAIFTGMAILLAGTILATIDWDVTHLAFDVQFLRGTLYLWYELFLDLFSIILLLGLALAVYRRYIQKPARLAASNLSTFSWDSFYLLLLLALIALTGLIMESLRLAVQNPMFALWSPIGFYLSQAFRSLSPETLRSLHLAFWSIHALLAFTFIAGIPFTKAFHMISATINIFFRDPSRKGSLEPANETGVAHLNDFTWRELLQIDSCTWCGRCQDFCPASAGGFPLSPCDLMMKLNAYLNRRTNGSSNGLHGGVVTAPELWSCTTCMACEANCPVWIEHPRLIVDLRRHLLNEGKMDQELQDALTRLGRYGNAFGQPERKRAQWTKDLPFPVPDARKEAVEYLWYVGYYASYDARLQPISRLTAGLFRRAGLQFGILYEAERNTGNDARRAGEEGLFDLLREKNLDVLRKATFNRVVTTDPHTFHALKNEYGANGRVKADEDGCPFPRDAVQHYSELLNELLQSGELTVSQSLPYTVTYQDPCYLGRYNGVFDAPRQVLQRLGVKLIEMPRHGAQSFCCGAGGGRIMMKDMPDIKERPAVLRVQEALKLEGVTHLVVACPKDYAMLQDAVKTVGAESRLRVVDLSELVEEATANPQEVVEPS